ncbi:hypothetical protein [Nesterenkonia sphaerica]|uniref:Cytochrome d ubiquinol oxidase subunit II n=1 Tax=Nesterenkonia sphaerica TaxID=1804988 RepID=A0A5R9ACR5_9MICC|nr:hypothetical protein [Nesterenkonia sphaerica]TLP75626.1 hypothetical protein FEF27_08135 [Nesterenkonia sphaerica]
MPKLTFITGAILVVVGLAGYLFSIAKGTDHWTALIPSLVGLLLLVSGAIALKNLMVGVHIALVLALIGALGMLMPLANLGALFAGEAERPAAVLTALISLIVLVVYLVLGVRSFIQARRWKKANA